MYDIDSNITSDFNMVIDFPITKDFIANMIGKLGNKNTRGVSYSLVGESQLRKSSITHGVVQKILQHLYPQQPHTL